MNRRRFLSALGAAIAVAPVVAPLGPASGVVTAAAIANGDLAVGTIGKFKGVVWTYLPEQQVYAWHRELLEDA